jgi:formylglycine-generating enzyme required for sulfatase activity
MAELSQTHKKYCLNCFHIIDTAVRSCPHCDYVQPENFNPIYLKPPHRLNQQYIIGRVLGHGGFAITYLGYDRHLGTRVAIKEYFPAEFATRAPDGENIVPYTGEKQTLFQLGKEKFIVEARLLATLRNPNIIRIRHFFEAFNTAYFVMEYLEGQTLKEYIDAQGGQLSWQTTKELLWPMLDALEEVHVKQCFHRDIKPDNIYISRQGLPILLDFGAARQQMSGATTNLLAFLTPGFAPAEQYSANGIQGPWTDIYALAATMYYALTGQVPPVPQDRALGEIELVPPSRLGISIPRKEEEWLLKGLEVKWSHRPESVQEWRRMMERHTVTTTMELKAHELEKEMEMAFLRSAILPRLMSRFLTPDGEREIREAATFVGLKAERIDSLIEQALLMTGSERRQPEAAAPAASPVAPESPAATTQPVKKSGQTVAVPKEDSIPAAQPAQAAPPPEDKPPASTKKRSESAPVSPLLRKAMDPKDTSVLPPRIRNSMGMEFVLVRPFALNGDQTDYKTMNMGTAQKPYKVTLTHSYYLQTTQITQGQWRVVMGHNPAHFQGDDWQPVEQIAWDDISAFLQRLNMLNEGYYRLPTEAEWEFACRAESESLYSFGNDESLLEQYAWYDQNAQGRPHAVGLKKPNRWGLYDMHGNVWEWVSDRFGLFPEGQFTDPKGPDAGASRVMRGGSWNLGPNYCKTVSRNYESPGYKANNLGARLLLEAY